ncbi:MAG TPA: branched-chain amino acid ABC transporter permease [Solirubrobacteraceae bacterium]|nr:branched-chain amino acid ABC transporter permease [Solirubrobacteraceae bacterium]
MRALARVGAVRAAVVVLLAALAFGAVSSLVGEYRDLQLADGAYYFAALIGLSVLIGFGGKISLGHGAFMAVGAYAVALLVADEHWPLVGALAAATAVSALVGAVLGAAASRLQGPYLAGVTLTLAVALPQIGNRFPETLGGENGLVIDPPAPPSFLGSSFPPQRYLAWIAGLGALAALFFIYNMTRSGAGRALRAVRDDEVAAALCGCHVGRTQTVAFVLSAACAGLGGGLATVVLQLAQPGAFPLELSLRIFAAAVIGGVGSLWGAFWAAALLVLLPNWSHDIAQSLSLSGNVAANLPLAIYGVMLIVAMLLWPGGIQAGLRQLSGLLKRAYSSRHSVTQSNPAK